MTNITKDGFADFGPTWSPDGRSIIYVARVSGNEKLFRVDLATGQKTQLTFGTHDDSSAQFVDQDTLIFSSTATNPSQPIDPDVARNGQIYNIWTLGLKNGELRQYTDAMSGNTTPIVVLACTHYPFMANVFRRLAPWPVDWLDPAEAIARRARSLLPRRADALHPEEDDAALFTGGRPDFATRRLMNSFGLKVA